MSAISNCVFWNEPIVLPNCFLWLTYLRVSSRAPCAIPRPTAPTPIRPISSVCIIILKPSPSLPIRFSLGTIQLSKIRSAVAEARIPIFFSCLPIEKPGASAGITRIDIPLLPFDLSVITTVV